MSLKIIALLAVVQIALAIFLISKLESHEDRIDALVVTEAQPIASGSTTGLSTLSSRDNSIDGQTGDDNQQLRRIIREELQAALSHIDSNSQTTNPNQETPVYDALEMQYQRELVIQELEALKQQAEVTGGELERLMGDIAKLNPEARTEMINMLNQALNRGEIEGHL